MRKVYNRNITNRNERTLVVLPRISRPTIRFDATIHGQAVRPIATSRVSRFTGKSVTAANVTPRVKRGMSGTFRTCRHQRQYQIFAA